MKRNGRALKAVEVLVTQSADKRYNEHTQCVHTLHPEKETICHELSHERLTTTPLLTTKNILKSVWVSVLGLVVGMNDCVDRFNHHCSH